MRSRWSDREAAAFVDRYQSEYGEALALRTYSSRLLGAEPDLVLHGGGNSSVKGSWRSLLGEEIPAVFVKGSGLDMAAIEPAGHVGLDLAYLRRLRTLSALDDSAMVEQLRTHLLRAGSPTPSIEALVHAFLPGTYIDHTHADAILALTNRFDGGALTRAALGEGVIVLPYTTPGFRLALAAAQALEAAAGRGGHGVEPSRLGHLGRDGARFLRRDDRSRDPRRAVPGGPPPPGGRVRRAAAAATTDAGPTRGGAEAAPAGAARSAGASADPSSRLAMVAPMIRGALAERTGDCDRPYRRVVVQCLTDPELLAALEAPGARENLTTPPLTSDHLIRTKALPLWLEGLPFDDPAELRRRIDDAVEELLPGLPGVPRPSRDPDAGGRAALRPPAARGPHPRQRSALCRPRPAGIHHRPRHHAAHHSGQGPGGGDGRDGPARRGEQRPSRRLRRQPGSAALPGSDRGRAVQDGVPLSAARQAGSRAAPLRGHVALVTGAAGAIGTGICAGLLGAGCLVAATDLPGDPLDKLVRDLSADHPGAIIGVPLDVTDESSVAAAFETVTLTWGGVDLVVPNAGIAAVSPLTELDLERFRALERVNVEGTLLVLAAAGRFFRRQGTGGDIVLVSTKNVFAPGANFGAYSSTKAAAHQLARIASLELAADDVRVNMVAPDAVFSHGACRSGLWAEVGPDRMKARGLDEAGLETYYQSRNLLKVRVTAEHVANGIVFFATRQTPTTGATIPVDGGLPDSTPR